MGTSRVFMVAGGCGKHWQMFKEAPVQEFVVHSACIPGPTRHLFYIPWVQVVAFPDSACQR